MHHKPSISCLYQTGTSQVCRLSVSCRKSNLLFPRLLLLNSFLVKLPSFTSFYNDIKAPGKRLGRNKVRSEVRRSSETKDKPQFTAVKMGFTFAVIVSALFFCIFHASSALVIPSGKAVFYDENSEAYNVHILESGSKFDEKITISEDDDLEYFHVPAHNGLTEVDYLYDFRNNLSVSRVKSEAKCYLGPLPENLPKPKDLRAGLERQSRAPSKAKVIAQKYWTVSEQVDKSLLRQELQDFCDQFPMYRLEKVNFEYAAGLTKRSVERARIARFINLSQLPFCDQTSLDVAGCHPHEWLYSFHIRQSHCTYWVIDCRFDAQRLKVCEEWEHMFSSMVCYKIRCP